jgi:hypothetical protein
MKYRIRHALLDLLGLAAIVALPLALGFIAYGFQP